MADDDLIDAFDDAFDEDEFLAAWAEADHHAATVLREAIPDVLDSEPPMHEVARAAERIRAEMQAGTEEGQYFTNACGWDEPPDIPLQLWLQAAGSTISPHDDPGIAPELEAEVSSMEHADWLALIVGLVRRGVGAELDGAQVADDLVAMPEIDTDQVPERNEYDLTVEVLAPLWQALGAIDADRRLTPLGWWGLPRALYLVWTTSEEFLDAPTPAAPRLDDADADAAIDLLREQPMTLAQLRSACAATEIFTDEDTLYRSVCWRPEVWVLEDQRLVHLPAVTDGLVLTHRLTLEEIELDALDPRVDLELYGLIAHEGLPLETGGEVRAIHAGGSEKLPAGWFSMLEGPDGWLADYKPGDMLAMRLHEGTMSVTPVDDVSDDDVEVLTACAWQAARQADPINQHGFEGITSDDVVMLARTDHPGVLREPGPPLREVLAATGLEEHLGNYGVPGTKWYGEPPLPDEQRAAYYAWRSALRSHERGLEPDDAELTAAAGLSDTALELAAIDAARHAPCAPLLEAIQQRATGAAAAGILYLSAREAEARLDGPAYVALLEQAVAADPTLHDAMADLAEVRGIQGDAAEAHRLFALADVDPSYPDRAALARFLKPPAAETGRNQPCPCGSGKKYKLCHGRSARHPLPDRAEWLWVKIKSFAQRDINREELLDWAELTSGADRDSREGIARAMTDSTTWEFAVFDGGILGRFLALYSGLLPADEADLVRGWMDSERRFLEVQGTHLTGVTARDLVTEETIELRDRTLPRNVKEKDLILGRFLDPGDGTLRAWDDPLGIPRMWRSRILSALRDGIDPRDLAAMLAPQGPPEIQTSEGEELLFSVARYRVGDPDQVWSALAPKLEDHGDSLHLMGGDDGSTVRGSVTRDDDVFTLEALSLQRLRALQALLADADPGARLIDESTRSPGDMLAEGHPRGAGPEQIELSPEDRAGIARTFEDRWLRQPIPALEGSSPREAAEDPRLRKELAALLEDFELVQRDGSGIAMDVDRLRSELGL